MNELENLRHIAEYLYEFNEVIFVDGNSVDGTVAFISENFPQSKLINQGQLRGKGSAIALGILAAESDYVLLLDADLPISLNEVRSAMTYCDRNPEIDLLKGSRHLKLGGSEDLTLVRNFGAQFFALLTKILFRVNWTEMCYGFWILKREHIEKLKIHEILQSPQSFLNFQGLPYAHSFEFDQVLFLRSHKLQLLIEEIPSFELKRNYGPSKLSALKDGLRTLSVIIIERIRR